MKKVWIVVANSCLAKVYRANGQSLVEHGILYHDEGHLHASELVSDRQGKETNRMTCGSDTYQVKTPIKVKEANIFANSIAQFLETGCQNGEYESIYIVAKPPFLGHLRQSLHPNVAKLVNSEIHKELTHLKPEELREYLPLVL